MKTTITASRLIIPVKVIEHPVLVLEDEHILSVGPRSEISVAKNLRHYDFPDAILAPGFIDIHIHGGNGHDVMETSNSALAAIERGMLQHGVTSYLATTVTAPLAETLRSLEHLGKAARASRGGASMLGIH